MRGFESHNAMERYTFEEMINAKRGGSSPPLERRSINVQKVSPTYQLSEDIKQPFASEPSSAKRLNRNEKLGYMESAFPRLQSERKLSDS